VLHFIDTYIHTFTRIHTHTPHTQTHTLSEDGLQQPLGWPFVLYFIGTYIHTFTHTHTHTHTHHAHTRTHTARTDCNSHWVGRLHFIDTHIHTYTHTHTHTPRTRTHTHTHSENGLQQPLGGPFVLYFIKAGPNQTVEHTHTHRAHTHTHTARTNCNSNWAGRLCCTLLTHAHTHLHTRTHTHTHTHSEDGLQQPLDGPFVLHFIKAGPNQTIEHLLVLMNTSRHTC